MKNKKMGNIGSNIELIIHSPPERDPWEYEHEKLVEIDGISALYIDNGSKVCNVFCHGIRCDIFDSLPFIDNMSKENNHIIFDYPGYGLSKGNLNETNCVQAIKKVVKWVKADRINLIGHSMGCCLLARFCSEEKWIEPVTFLSPFHDVQSLLPIKIEFPFYQTIEHVKNMKCGITFYHGTNDETIPVEHSIKLAAVHGSTLHIDDSDHKNILKHVIKYVL